MSQNDEGIGAQPDRVSALEGELSGVRDQLARLQDTVKALMADRPIRAERAERPAGERSRVIRERAATRAAFERERPEPTRESRNQPEENEE